MHSLLTKRIKYLAKLLSISIFITALNMPLLAQDKTEPVKVSHTFKSSFFPLVHKKMAAIIYVDANDGDVVKIAAEAFRQDVNLITEISPEIVLSGASLKEYPVIFGTIGKSKQIDKLIADKKIDADKVQGKWETFSIALVENPSPTIKKALVIYGSDIRGTAFGIFEFSRRMGVLPFSWWADITPQHYDDLYVMPGKSIDGPPSVKYRGVFLNDEDWGLRPWAAKNMDKDKSDIGPRTYEKVFELLLRLKANYIWPAMHPGTKAFWHYTENPEIARKYSIIMGSSHHEPMLRNTEYEWNEKYAEEYGKEHGPWRYDTNQKEIYQFFDDRVKQSVNNEAYYTVGMRGTVDGGMSGPSDVKEKVKLLETVIADQRKILTQRLGRPASEVLQVFCPYKEVLTLYQAGLQVPDDVTITWVDDNHGYIRQLPNPQEQQRSGGNGIYYHVSYWGVPQDYLWLSSTSTSLISYELSKAYQYKADRMWVINVGDIKPAEMETQFAMDLAWDVKAWPPEKAHLYAKTWAEEIFGKELSVPIAEIKSIYYRLSAAGKPEHINRIAFSEGERDSRIKQYQELALKADKLLAKVPSRLKDAYFELVLYPVMGSKLMNEKVFFSQKSTLVKGTNNQLSKEYLDYAQKAYDQIQAITKQYNEVIASGKWAGMMDASPRHQAIFSQPKDAATLAAGKPDPFRPVMKDSATKVQIISASNYVRKTDFPGAEIKSIEGLGVGGKGVSIVPYLTKSYAETNVSDIPFVEYNVKLSAGQNKILIKCLPTFKINNGFEMRVGVSVDGGNLEMESLETLAESKIWTDNVLRGFMQAETLVNAEKDREAKIKIYLTDPGLVINQIEIQAIE